MLSFQLVESIDDLLETIDQQKDLLSILSKLSEYSSYNGPDRYIHSFVLMSAISSVSVKVILFQLQAVNDAFAKFFFVMSSEKFLVVESHLKLFIEFERLYEIYLKSDARGETDVDKLAKTAYDVQSFLELLRDFLRIIWIKLESESPLLFENTQGLSVLLGSTQTLSQFSAKLFSLQRIYDELAMLLSVSTVEHPVRIIKIESGSFWADILGYPKIIELMESLITGAVSYMHRNFTREGKITSVPRSVEAIDTVLELRSKLRNAGLDTTLMDKHIEKSSAIVAIQLNHLLAGEARVTINHQVYSVGEDFEQKYLEESRRQLLPEFTSSNQGDN